MKRILFPLTLLAYLLATTMIQAHGRHPAQATPIRGPFNYPFGKNMRVNLDQIYVHEDHTGMDMRMPAGEIHHVFIYRGGCCTAQTHCDQLHDGMLGVEADTGVSYMGIEQDKVVYRCCTRDYTKLDNGGNGACRGHGPWLLREARIQDGSPLYIYPLWHDQSAQAQSSVHHVQV